MRFLFREARVGRDLRGLERTGIEVRLRDAAAVLSVKPRFVVNDIHAACDEVRAGNGIGLVPISKAKKHRELVRIFPAFNDRIRQAWLVYRKTSYMPAIITETVKQRIEAASLSWFSRNNDWALEQANVRPDWPEAGVARRGVRRHGAASPPLKSAFFICL